MFANVEIITDVKSTAVSVPQSAVLDDGGKKIVFVTDGKITHNARSSWESRAAIGLKSSMGLMPETG
jgi:multidrug efflux pump subunit AcrA (membrane-fusion protein)